MGGVSSFLDLLFEALKALEENRMSGKVAGSRRSEKLPHGLKQQCPWLDVSLREGLTNGIWWTTLGLGCAMWWDLCIFSEKLSYGFTMLKRSGASVHDCFFLWEPFNFYISIYG